MQSAETIESAFLNRYRGYLKGILPWADLDQLFDRLRRDKDREWFIYAVGEPVPTTPVTASKLNDFLTELRQLLDKEHDEDYCGIVYVDNPDAPHLVKVFDPNNLGVSCGFSDNPPLPGWVISKDAPIDLQAAFPPPGNRRRWWQKLFPA